MKHLLFAVASCALCSVIFTACSDDLPVGAAAEVYAQGTVPWTYNGGAASVKEGVNYLSDLEMDYAYNGWGPVERDASNGEARAGDGQTLTLNAQTYEKGLGVHPAGDETTWSEVRYDLAGQCDTFSATVGLDDEIDVQERHGSVYFQVFADGEKLWQSERLTGQSDAAATGDLNIRKAGKLRLVVTNAGDNNWFDHADWADAKVVCDRAMSPGDPVSVSYKKDTTNFLNPERGFHDNIDVMSGTNFSYVRELGYSLVRSYIRLDDYRNRPLDGAFLSDLRRGLDAVRAANLKIIPRFTYNFPTGEYRDAPEASVGLTLRHIRQLTPIYLEYADIIAVHPAGFVGAWGEWHSSGRENLDAPENKRKILNALLDALPTNVMLQLRYPGDLVDTHPQVLKAENAFSGSDQARVGHHNDCFLSNRSDAGTYLPEEKGETFKRYLDDLTAFTPVGGETCQVTLAEQRTDCDTALEEMARFRWDYLNVGFYAPTIERWRKEGCFEEISKRLGYRYRLTEVRASANSVTAGEAIRFELDLRNDGFGKLYNPRPTQLIFVGRSGERHSVTLSEDSRKLLPAPGETKTLSVTAELASLEKGTYDLYLNLPDGSSSLRGRPEYSIRLANQDVWRAETGYNALNLSIEVR